MASPRPSGLSLIVPTLRAAQGLALAAPVALVVAALHPDAWLVVPLGALVMLVLVLLDGLAAGTLRAFELWLPADTEVGAAALARVTARLGGGASAVEVALACDPRLADGGVMEGRLSREDGEWTAGIAFTPSRRGSPQVGLASLRWTGPLGLGARLVRLPQDTTVRVWPNTRAARGPTLQAFLRDVQAGLVARRMSGEGQQFEALADYQPGMDRRRIDWKSSARHGRLHAREYEIERNNQIVFAFDCGQAMCEPVAGLSRLDRAVSAALAASYVALKGGDRVMLYGFAARPAASSPFVSSPSEFRRLQQAAAGLDYRAEEPNFTLAMATLSSRLARRSLIVVFSDFTDPAGAELMVESLTRLVSRHVVLFVTLVDEELEAMSHAAPEDLDLLTRAVAADQLLRQRALVTGRLRQAGIDVIEAPHDRIDARLIDAYLSVKRKGAIA